MDHKQYMDSVKEYRQRSGHSINYFDGGPANNSPVLHPGLAKPQRGVQKVSLAKDKMRDLHGRADGSVNRGIRRKNMLGEINDTK